MKIMINDENNIVIFLNKLNIQDINFEDREQLESYFRKLFNMLNNNYNLKISGFYYIYIYVNDIYGIIIEMDKQVIDFIEFYNNQIDMHITIIKNAKVLYEIKDPFFLDDNTKNKVEIYTYKGNIFLMVKEDLDNITMGRIIENSNIVYGIIADRIVANKKVIALNK